MESYYTMAHCEAEDLKISVEITEVFKKTFGERALRRQQPKDGKVSVSYPTSSEGVLLTHRRAVVFHFLGDVRNTSVTENAVDL